MNKRIEKLLYLISIIVVVWIVGCLLFYNGIWKNQRLLLWFGVAAGFLLFGKIRDCLQKKETWIQENYAKILAGFLLVYGMLMLIIGLNLRFEPIFDLEAIFGGAKEWYLTGDFEEHKWYFYRNRNNMGGLIILYVADLLLGFLTEDFFLIALLVNIVGVLVTIAMISVCSKELWGHTAGVIGLVLVVFMLPYLFMGGAFYTDTLSMPYVAVGTYLFIKLFREESIKRKAMLSLIIGIICCIGFWIKGTALIILLAGVMVLMLRNNIKTGICCLASMLAGFLLVNFLVNAIVYDVHLTDVERRSEVPPSTHWVMMGLKGRGMYNAQDFEFTYGFTDEEERADAIREEIVYRIKERGLGGMLKLFADKTVIDYGEGTLGLSDYLDDNPQKESFFHKYVLYDGQYYSLYRAYCSTILLVILFYFWAFLLRAKDIQKGPASELMIAVGFIGIFMLLMLWESSYRYFTNYTPLLMIGAVSGIEKWKETKEKLKGNYRITKMKEKMSDLWKQRSIKIFSYAILFRLGIYIVYLFIMTIQGDYQGAITLSDYTDAWRRWDGSHYLKIAEHGYSGAIENGQHLFLVFYPLYPWLIKIVSLLVNDYRCAALLVSVICYGIGSVYFDKLLCKEYNVKIAKNAALMLAVFPFSFFFGSIMTESLFFVITAAFFYYLREHKWGKVAFVGFLACLTKVQGMLLALAVIAEVFSYYHGIRLLREKKWRIFWRDVIGNGMKCVPMIGGTLTYLLINFIVEGDPFRFMYYQKNHWHNGLCPIWETISYVSKNVLDSWHTSTGMSLWVPEFLLFFLYIAIIIYGFKKKMHPVYMTYLVTFFILTYSSTWLISGGRYTLSALPLFILLGQFMEEHEKVRKIVVPLSFALMIVYMTGYFQWKQIM